MTTGAPNQGIGLSLASSDKHPSKELCQYLNHFRQIGCCVLHATSVQKCPPLLLEKALAGKARQQQVEIDAARAAFVEKTLMNGRGKVRSGLAHCMTASI